MLDVFRFEGLDALEEALKGFETLARADVSLAIVSLSNRILEGAVMGTPQWSGGATASWRVGIGAPAYEDRTDDYTNDEDTIFSMQNRNPRAVAEAIGLGQQVLGGYGLGMGDIYIMNGVDYAVGFPFRQAGPDWNNITVALRVENLPQRSMYRLVHDVLQAPRPPGMITQLTLGV